MHIHRKGAIFFQFTSRKIKITAYTQLLTFIFRHLVSRSSDSTKYGTNKSSGASVTSGKHAKNQQAYGAHESVSNNGKPPMHPNHHHNVYNHKPTSTTTTTTTTTSTSTATPIPVHNSKNGPYNNNVYRTSPYAYNVNCYDDSGYLESRPLSSSSFYGDGQRVSRGTKSDIGVPCRRPTASKIQSSNNNTAVQYGRIHENRLPSVKSDFLLTYLNNNHTDDNIQAKGAMPMHRRERPTHTAQPRDHYVSDKKHSRGCTKATAYHISGILGNNGSDMSKTDGSDMSKPFSTTTITNSKLEYNEHIRTSPSHKINEQQRNRIINFLNRSVTEPSSHAHNTTNSQNAIQSKFASNLCDSRQASNVVGPLLYVDPTSETLPSNNTTCSNSRAKQSHPFQAVSK